MLYNTVGCKDSMIVWQKNVLNNKTCTILTTLSQIILGKLLCSSALAQFLLAQQELYAGVTTANLLDVICLEIPPILRHFCSAAGASLCGRVYAKYIVCTLNDIFSVTGAF